MGPKAKQVTEVIPILGAKISTVLIGNQQDINNNNIFQKVNLNCPLDIVLDYIKKQLINNLENKIREIEIRLQDTNNNNGNNNGNNNDDNNNNNNQILSINEKEKLVELQQKYNKVKRTLQEENITNLELFDGSNCLFCQQKLKSLALEVMNPNSFYSLGYITTNETGQIISIPYSLDGEIKPSSPTKKK